MSSIKVQFKFTTASPVAILMDGLNAKGQFRTKWNSRSAGTKVYGFGIEEGQEAFAFQIRDEDGCSVDYGNYTVPTSNQWQAIE